MCIVKLPERRQLLNIQQMSERLFVQPLHHFPRRSLEQTGTGEIAHNLLTGTLRRTTKTRTRGKAEEGREREDSRETKEVHHCARAPTQCAAHQAINFSHLRAKNGQLRVNFQVDHKGLS